MSGRQLVGATLLVIAVSAVVIGLRGSARRAAAPTPMLNVVLITLDTTRADRLGAYGYDAPTSPRIDALAQAGTLFTNAYTSASVTPVSHASILTGLHPYGHGLRVLHGLDENRLREEAVTLAEVLKHAGYLTAAFVSAFPAGSRFGLSQGFDTFDEDFGQTPPDTIVTAEGTVNTGNNQRRASVTTDLALDWLDSATGPWFLWIHYFDPHDVRLLPPPEFMAQFPAPTGPVPDRLLAVYDIEIQYMDRQLGRVLDALETAGRGADTVVALVSDHGQGLGDHGWWTHGVLYEEQIKAPLIVRGPGVPAGRRVNDLVRTIDLMPTLLEMAGVDPEADMDGTSLMPLLRGDPLGEAVVAYADSVNMLTYGSASGFSDDKNEMLFAVIDGRWKYIHHLIREQESELYDLALDPGELENLYASRPEHVERLRQDLAARAFQPDARQGRGQMSHDDLERLRSLGYLR